MAVLATALTLSIGDTAQAQSAEVLVSNPTGQADAGAFSADATKRAQGFVIGSVDAG